MGSASAPKRAPPSGNERLSSRARRKKFRRAGVRTETRADLSHARRGVLVSCTPGHEQHAFRDAVVLLSRFAHARAREEATQPRDLAQELAAIRSGDERVFTRVLADVKGAVFLRVDDERVDVERVVTLALLEARQSGYAGSRHCIRLIPVRATCYAKAETAAQAALSVVKDAFPRVHDERAVSFAIVFRARLNNSAKRQHFIDAIANAIHQYEPRYRVDLTNPDVVLIVEVLKTSCCLGTFRQFYQLAKLNLREAACASEPKHAKQHGKSKVHGANGDEQAAAPPDGNGGEREAAPPDGNGGEREAAPPDGNGGKREAAPPDGNGGEREAAPADGNGGKREEAPPDGNGGEREAAPPDGNGGEREAAPLDGNGGEREAAPPDGNGGEREAAPPDGNGGEREAAPPDGNGDGDAERNEHAADE